MNELPEEKPFVPERIEQAHHDWKCNCGPSAFAAITRTEIEWCRQFFPHFPKRAYTTFADMENALCKVKRTVSRGGPVWPEHGVVHMWFAVPGKGYRMSVSHWVACARFQGVQLVYDMNDRWECWWGGWQTVANWEKCVLPLILQPSGALGYRLTRSYEVSR